MFFGERDDSDAPWHYCSVMAVDTFSSGRLLGLELHERMGWRSCSHLLETTLVKLVLDILRPKQMNPSC